MKAADEAVDRWIDRGALRRSFERTIVVQSLSVAFIVGTILNAINQGAELIEGRPINILRLVLTYSVPFFVATYGAYSAFRKRTMTRIDER